MAETSALARDAIRQLKHERVRTSQIIEAVLAYVLWQHSVAVEDAMTKQRLHWSKRSLAEVRKKAKDYERAAKLLNDCRLDLMALGL